MAHGSTPSSEYKQIMPCVFFVVLFLSAYLLISVHCAVLIHSFVLTVKYDVFQIVNIHLSYFRVCVCIERWRSRCCPLENLLCCWFTSSACSVKDWYVSHFLTHTHVISSLQNHLNPDDVTPECQSTTLLLTHVHEIRLCV